MTSAQSKGGQAFVLGHPVDHSLSPLIHQSAYDFLGLNIEYSRWDTTEETLADRFAFASESATVQGFSCTMPLKSKVREFLDNETPFASAVGVVNTVYWRESDGVKQAWGHNTDVSGIVNALVFGGFEPGKEKQEFAILGGGGTATSAVAALSFLGAGSIDVFVRSVERAQRVQEVADRLGVEIIYRDMADFSSNFGRYAALVSTLPGGAADSLCAPMEAKTEGVLLDVSYDVWPSKIAQKWQAAGGAVVSGKDMLMYQAIDQIKLFIGKSPDTELEGELEMINLIAAKLGLAERRTLPLPVYSAQQLG